LELFDLLGSALSWLSTNAVDIVFLIVVLAFMYGFYNVASRQVTRLRREGRLDETAAFLLKRSLRWGLTLAFIAFSISQLGIRVDLVAGLFVLAGGTVIGFAAMNTLGNAIAGLILMVSGPFKIGDRLYFDEQFMDVVEINLIYTRMRTPDRIIVSVPNQKLIQTDVYDYGKDRVVRRRHSITVGYGDSHETVEAALLEAAGQVELILKDPQPYVWITEFQNFAIEYTLFVYIEDLKRILEIDSSVRKAILEACERHGIDLSTPNLIRSLR